MAAKSNSYYLMKTGRFTGWVLLVLILTYLSTGYAMCDKYELKRVISVENAQIIHRAFDLALLYAFLLHAGVSVYFAFRRWRWIRPRARA